MEVEIIRGDILNQDTEAIVNSWNRNIIPWWLLLPQGVSGAIKKKGGYRPFSEVGKMGPIPLGGAVYTSAGKLPYKYIIHVAGINMLWMASEYSIKNSVINAMKVAEELKVESLAFPVIGAGSGSFNQEKAKQIMLDTFAGINSQVKVILVEFNK